MATDKRALREQFLTDRAAMSPFVASQSIGDLADWMYHLPVDVAAGDTVAAYVPTRREPGGIAMLDALADQGLRVLLPVVPEGEPTALQWGEYAGERSLEEGRWNLLTPHGPRLEPEALRKAKVILVPAVAVDRRGVRLGRGAGYYDRSLAEAPGLLVAVVHDSEFVETELPESEFDVRVQAVLTPSNGFSVLTQP